MKLALMQPYFFPYLGYYQLIAAVDVFVVYDDVQYIKNGWINRNRILVNQAASWITMPVERGHLRDNINQRAFINYLQSSQNILNQLHAAYRKAPFHDETRDLVQSILEIEEDNVAMTLRLHLEQISRHLGISTQFLDSSTLNKQDHGLNGPNRVMEICRTTNASEYYNSIGGIPLYDPTAFSQSNIALHFVQPRPQIYLQYNNSFVSNLSIIDVLMFNGIEKTGIMLREYDLVDKSMV
jgi:hypothetical protein